MVILEASGKHESPVFDALGYEAVRFADSLNLLYGPPEDCDRLHRLVKVP